jgi:hypothetical protein
MDLRPSDRPELPLALPTPDEPTKTSGEPKKSDTLARYPITDGFRSFPVAEAALLHTLGKLPEPKSLHRFC